MKSSTKLIVKAVVLVMMFQSVPFAQQNEDQLNGADDSVFVMSKSPLTAVLLSAVIPGAGQIYNESYLKAPVIWGIAVGLYLGYQYYDKRYDNYKDLFAQTRLSVYKSNRDFYRDQRDLMTIYMGLAYVLNLVDAYVDAHLFDFTVKHNFQTSQPMFGLRVKF